MLSILVYLQELHLNRTIILSQHVQLSRTMGAVMASFCSNESIAPIQNTTYYSKTYIRRGTTGAMGALTPMFKNAWGH